MPDGVVERLEEFHALGAFLASSATEPSALLLEGEAGIGKTTLWLAGLEQAAGRGFQVLSARAVAMESVMAYATVADLLGGVDSATLADLPAPQRLAVDRVLLRASSEGSPTDSRAVSAAFLSVVERLAEQAPVLVAIDDLQWVDASSALVIEFVARRLSARVGIYCTVRADPGIAHAPSWLQLDSQDLTVRIRLRPLSLGGIRALLFERLGHSVPRPTLLRIFEASGGNPFYALELARAVDGAGARLDTTLPGTLAELVRSKIGDLDDDVQQALLAAASLGTPTVDLVARGLALSPEELATLIVVAESRGIVGIAGARIYFTHPLLAHGVYTSAAAAQRRAMHRRLAEVVEEPELRARHLAKAVTVGEPQTLQALDAAAELARMRGAPAAAAELLDLAIGLGGEQPERVIASARHHFDAGDTERARTMLEETIDRISAGPLRAQAACLLGVVRLSEDSFVEAVDVLQRALRETGEDHPLRAQIFVTLSFALENAGDVGAAMQTAEHAVATAERTAQPNLLSQALSMRVVLGFIRGAGLDAPSMRRALELENRAAAIPVVFRPSVHNMLLLAWTGQLERADEEMRSVWRECDELGAESDLIFLTVHRVMIHLWRGHLAEAALVAEDAMQRALQLGGDFPLFVALTARAACGAYAGSDVDARRDAIEAITASERCGSRRLQEWPLRTLAFIEVSIGNYEAAVAAVEPLLHRLRAALDGTEFVTAGFVPDVIEAMIALGRHAEAEPLIDAFERNGRRLNRTWMLAEGARGRAMLLAVQGNLAAAHESARQAMREYDRLEMPFERARTQLLLGQLQRRQRKKDVAAATLREALGVFEQLGTPLWGERARAELARVKVGPRQSTVLTPSEQRIAELAATGMTNRDVAAKLFISHKTVEVNLSRVYRKLGIHSRVELGRLVGQPTG